MIVTLLKQTFPIEFRLRLARLLEEDGYPDQLIAEQPGISQDSVYRRKSDIITFPLAGKNANLVGYLDDCSRFITGKGFYCSQTAEHVIETYCRDAPYPKAGKNITPFFFKKGP